MAKWSSSCRIGHPLQADASGRRGRRLTLLGSLAVLALLPGAPAVLAADAPQSAAVKALLTRALADLPGKEVQMVTVEYPPGGSSAPHRHDAHVFVYVLQGTLRMQVAGGAPVLLHPGEVFYEGPNDIHEVSANASASEPAKFLAVILKDVNRPASRPVKPTG